VTVTVAKPIDNPKTEGRALRPAFSMRHRGSSIYFCDFERGFFDGEMKRIRGGRDVHE
jgi:hypothetical protein